MSRDIFEITKLWQGCITYSDSTRLQETLKKQAKGNQKAWIMGFECPACITLGLRGKTEEDVLSPAKKHGIDVVSIRRGGQATLHSPGQLVIYPILDLRKWKIYPRDYLHVLEQITIQTLKKCGVHTEKQGAFAGLFTDYGKIAFFGIHISEGVSQHGLAINVTNDLGLFHLIRSCGVSHRTHDSLQRRRILMKPQELFSLWYDEATLFFKHS